MSRQRPLYAHPDLEGGKNCAYIWYDREKKQIRAEKDRPENVRGHAGKHEVSKNVSRAVMDEMFELLRMILEGRARSSREDYTGPVVTRDGYCVDAQAMPLPVLEAFEPEIEKQVEIMARSFNDPRNQLEPESAEHFLALYDYRKRWNGESPEILLDRMEAIAANNGKDIDRDELAQAVLLDIRECVEQGLALTDSQQAYWESNKGEVSRMDEKSPLRQKPVPLGGATWIVKRLKARAGA